MIDYTLGPWEDGRANTPWYLRLICALFGHDEISVHPRVHDCRRCMAYRRVLSKPGAAFEKRIP